MRARTEKVRAEIIRGFVLYSLKGFISAKLQREREYERIWDTGNQCLFLCVSVWWCWNLGLPS